MIGVLAIPVRRTELESAAIRAEVSRLLRREERHRRLFARLVLAAGLSTVVFVIGTVLIWATESGAKGGQIRGIGDAAFFTAVQLLTVSSAISNPLASGGKVFSQRSAHRSTC